jgi:hypothetical protein
MAMPTPPSRAQEFRHLVIDYLKGHPGLTATEISTGMRLVSTPIIRIAAMLAKEFKDGGLRREGGPHKGGWRYFPVEAKSAGPTSWDHILNDKGF